MFNFQYDIEQAEKEYIKELRKSQKELKPLPEGYLVKRTKQGYSCYFHVIQNQEKGISKDHELISQLIHKRYLIEYTKRLEKNLCEIRRLKQNYQDISSKAVIAVLPGSHKTMAQELILSAQAAWQNEPYIQSNYMPEKRKYATHQGVMVRSKSEQLIGSALEANSIPYRYEAQLKLAGRVFYPDFTIKRQKDGDIITWEHLGMMDDEDYATKADIKVKAYETNGLHAWDKIIYTYEEDTKDSRKINDIIQIML